MLLSDTGIIGAINTHAIGIENGPASIQPASIDVRLSRDLHIFTDTGDPVIDPEHRQDDGVLKRIPERGFLVNAGEFLLGSTVEKVTVGPGYAMQFTGKSSLARLGLQVHMTAGHIDPGFHGRITLELLNVRSKPFRLRENMWIGQLLVFRLDQPAQRPYGHPELESRYMAQSTVTASRSWM